MNRKYFTKTVRTSFVSLLFAQQAIVAAKAQASPGNDLSSTYTNPKGNTVSSRPLSLKRMKKVIVSTAAITAASALAVGASVLAFNQESSAVEPQLKVSCTKKHSKLRNPYDGHEIDFRSRWFNPLWLKPGKVRQAWEAQLHLDTKKPVSYGGISAPNSEAFESTTRILFLPSTATHLRQMLQELFLAADVELGDLDHRISKMHLAKKHGEDIDLDELKHLQSQFVVEVARSVAKSQPFAWAELFTRKEFRRLGGGLTYTCPYPDLFSAMAHAQDGVDALREYIDNRQTQLLRIKGDVLFKIYDYARQVYLLKFVDDFRFGENKTRPGRETFDRIGYNEANARLGIVEYGLNDNKDGAGENPIGFGHPLAYNQNFDISGKFVIDFNHIDRSVHGVERITPEMDDWQKDWPLSAALRFHIKGQKFDVYFPTKWDNFNPALTGNKINTHDLSLRKHVSKTGSDQRKFIDHPDGIVYFNSKNEIVPEQYLVSSKEPFRDQQQDCNSNEGLYELQTPYILRAFQDRPLNAVWSLSSSRGHNGVFLPRWLGGQTKDEIFSYESLEEARNKYEYTVKFEMLWEGRSPFFPGANHFDVAMKEDHGSQE